MKQPQRDIRFDAPEPFALVAQSTSDGERVVKEREQKAADKLESEKKQLTLVWAASTSSS